jgi:hypothetical protein
MSIKKFTKYFLNNICKEKDIELVNFYNDEHINSQTDIEFLCSKCKKYVCKKFINIVKFNSLCKSCCEINKKEKKKQTMLKKYGVEHPFQSKEICDKLKKQTQKNMVLKILFNQKK